MAPLNPCDGGGTGGGGISERCTGDGCASDSKSAMLWLSVLAGAGTSGASGQILVKYWSNTRRYLGCVCCYNKADTVGVRAAETLWRRENR